MRKIREVIGLIVIFISLILCIGYSMVKIIETFTEKEEVLLENNFVVIYDDARREIIRDRVQELINKDYLVNKLDSLYNIGEGEIYYIGMMQDGIYIERKFVRIAKKRAPFINKYEEQ